MQLRDSFTYFSTQLRMPCIFLEDTGQIYLFIPPIKYAEERQICLSNPTIKYAMYSPGIYASDLLFLPTIKYALYIPISYVTDFLISPHN